MKSRRIIISKLSFIAVAHIAIQEQQGDTAVEWQEKVSDEQYETKYV